MATSSKVVAAGSSSSNMASGETVPLLNSSKPRKSNDKAFYRARPLWLVPFAITASLVRGMTLAPRVEVFTQLSCDRLYGDRNWNHTVHTLSTPISFASTQPHTALFTSTDPLGPPMHAFTSFPTSTITFNSNSTKHSITRENRRVPSSRCSSDPAVQAGAAKLQTIMTTTMGLLSALTTGWWGHFGERHGRTKVLALSTLGLFLTDLTFLLVSTPSSPISQHGHKFLLMAPVVEGIFGGWSTLQSAISAYLADCTSPGSRAGIFSRFTGVLYVGFAVGPSLGGWLIAHPLSMWIGTPSVIKGGKEVISVFWVAMWCSAINLLLVAFVFPESLDREKREKTRRERQGKNGVAKGKAVARPLVMSPETEASVVNLRDGDDVENEGETESEVEEESPNKSSIISRFFSPLSVFLPVFVLDPSGLGPKRRDWSLTLLAAAMMGYMLSTGVYQIKYLYAVHSYSWSAEQLSYYISLMGGLRALALLFILPTIISIFKPKPSSARAAPKLKVQPKTAVKASGKVQKPGPMVIQPIPPFNANKSKKSKPAPTRAHLGQEIAFDLLLTRCSLLIDVISHTLVAILPAPGYKAHLERLQSLKENAASPADHQSFAQSQAAFVLASALNSFGCGSVPAINSLALCILQVRALDARAASGTGDEEVEVKEEGTGALFGAFAMLQSVGQMIVGPMLFGLIYSSTVANFPQAIFVVSSGICVFALLMVLLVRNPVRSPVRPSKPVPKRRDREVQRGRSRVSKDLRGGAVGYYASTATVASSYASTTTIPSLYGATSSSAVEAESSSIDSEQTTVAQGV